VTSGSKKGAFLLGRLVAHGGKGISVRQLGRDRAGEMRITRFLHNSKVMLKALMSAALARTRAQVSGRHVLAIQDTSALRVDERGLGSAFTRFWRWTPMTARCWAFSTMSS
jgi:hypothetical protein